MKLPLRSLFSTLPSLQGAGLRRFFYPHPGLISPRLPRFGVFVSLCPARGIKGTIRVCAPRVSAGFGGFLGGNDGIGEDSVRKGVRGPGGQR